MLPYHIERARKRWQRQTRVGTAIALFGLSACSAGATSSFFTWDDEMPANVVQVSVAPLPGVSRDNADTLASALRAQTSSDKLKDTQISAVLGASRKNDGLYVIAIIDLKDKSGARINRIVDEKLVPTESAAGDAISIPKDELQRVASSAMDKLNATPPPAQLAQTDTRVELKSTADSETISEPVAVQMAEAQSDDALTTASIAPIFRINVGPTPGDGGVALTAALDKALKSQLASSRISGEYRIDGTVKTASTDTGDAAVSIEWLVSTRDGRKLGAITQKNSLSPERIAGHWNEVAVSAGQAAADGVLRLLDAPGPRS